MNYLIQSGDQVVSVNGESVMCKSYAQVVQMIQKSGPNLQLVVMPKEHDVLQQVQRTHAPIYLQKLSIKRSMTDLSFLSVLQIRPTIRTPMPGLQLFQVPPATNRPAK